MPNHRLLYGMDLLAHAVQLELRQREAAKVSDNSKPEPPKIDTTGMTRQQRRHALRKAAKERSQLP